MAHEAVCVAASPLCVAASPLTRAPTCLLSLRHLRGACRWHCSGLDACKVFAVQAFLRFPVQGSDGSLRVARRMRQERRHAGGVTTAPLMLSVTP